ncbi:MAG: hypothetical protein JOZ11_10220 [Alphaproteobacteria bacterium]|nr:hypothetical protein [Alphaproteobacteria bacterium]
MQTRKQDSDAIAEEAVGQRHGELPPYAMKKQPDMSQEEMTRRLSKSAGPRASIPEKTAEAVGERAGDAYADPGSAAARNSLGKIARLARPHERFSGNGAANPALGGMRQLAQVVTHQFDEQRFVMVAASFAVGYMTALWLHGRR